MNKQGCIHVYTGDGKGKTTAGVGLCTRALGRGLRVGFFQFMKSGRTGETVSLAKLGALVVSPQAGTKFIWDMNEEEKAACRALQGETLQRAMEQGEALDLLVLDEVICAVDAGMIDKAALEGFVAAKPAGLELVLTGRGAWQTLVDRADYVTEMRCEKHPFERGLPARKGVEF